MEGILHDTVQAKPLRTIMLQEIGISIVVTIAFNMIFALLLFDTGASIPLWGHSGIAVDLIPATFMPALMMTFGITLGTRHKVRQGTLRPGDYVLPKMPLPRLLPLRAVMIALAAVAVIAPVMVCLIALSGSTPWTWSHFIAFKLVFSILHAVLVTPFVIVTALRSSQ